LIQPFHLLVIALSGWLNRQQQAVIDYLIEENRVLKEQLEGQRLRFTDEQRIRLAVKANAFAERFVRSIKDECLDRIILFGEVSLRRTLREYVTHLFRSERNHQGVENRLLEPCITGNSPDGPIQCRERLGGMLNFYYWEAA
jgi:hypothetical protein